MATKAEITAEEAARLAKRYLASRRPETLVKLLLLLGVEKVTEIPSCANCGSIDERCDCREES